MPHTLQNVSLLLRHLSKVVFSSSCSASVYITTDPHDNPVRKESWVLLAASASEEDTDPQRNKWLAQGHLARTECEVRLECGSL